MPTYLNTEVIVKLVPITCCYNGCGVQFALGSEFVERRMEDHAYWYCPNGHQQHWSQGNETERLKSQLEASRRIASNERDRRQRAERQRAAARGQVTKIKRRVGRGVCPCCNRTFADLGRHMTGQHPEFADGASE